MSSWKELDKPAGLGKLNSHLANESYIAGCVIIACYMIALVFAPTPSIANNKQLSEACFPAPAAKPFLCKSTSSNIDDLFLLVLPVYNQDLVLNCF